jgi:hypothetical protein
MTGIAVLASLLAVPRLVLSPDRVVMICLVGLLTLLCALHVLVEVIIGCPCPSCGQWTLRRLVRHRFYYRCSSCRGRFQRRGLGPWLDASGPENDARFRRLTDAGTWKGYTRPKDLSGTTSGALLRNKRQTVPADLMRSIPHQPGRRMCDEAAARKVKRVLAQWRKLRE